MKSFSSSLNTERNGTRGELRAQEIDDKIALWVGFSWLKLLIGELHNEDVIRRIMMQIAGLPTGAKQ